jgi:hypothetical protein
MLRAFERANTALIRTYAIRDSGTLLISLHLNHANRIHAGNADGSVDADHRCPRLRRWFHFACRLDRSSARGADTSGHHDAFLGCTRSDVSETIQDVLR